MSERMVEVELYGGPSDGMRCDLPEELSPFELLTYLNRGPLQKPLEYHYQRINQTRYEYRGQS